MQAMNKAIQIVLQQLRGFSLTARMLIAAILVILVMGLVLVAVFAGRAEMVGLGLASEEARGRAAQYMTSHRIGFEDRGGDLFVSADDRYAVLGNLTENNLLSADQIDFSSVLKDDSPFTDRTTKKMRYLVAKMNEVARMISEWSVIDRAEVRIDHPDRPYGIGGPDIHPTAAVSVVTTTGSLPQSLSDSIARTVAGVHADLRVEDVTVVDARTGRSVTPRTVDDLASNRHLELKEAHEKRVKSKILELLDYIPGLRVAVNAQVDASEIITHQVGVEEPKIGVQGEKTRERIATNQTAASEPGVRPNTGGLDLSTSAGRTSNVTENETATTMRPVFPATESDIRRDQGYAVKIDASVLIPRSFFVKLYRTQEGDEGAEPDAPALQTLAQTETQKIRQAILPLIETDAAEGAVAGTVVVDMFTDLAGMGIGALGGGGALGGRGSVSGGLVNQSVIKTVGLAALAVVSLLLMFMMVRRAGREEEMPTAEELVGIPPALAQADSDLVGEATESAPPMEGVEIDEGALRRQQMLDQVNDLAQNSPAEAAALLRKWIKTDE